MITPRRRGGAALAGLLLALGLLSGCTRVISGSPSAAPPEFDSVPQGPPARIEGGTGSPTDTLAADVITGIESYWRQEFPAAFGHPWTNVHGYFAVDPGDPRPPTTCLRRAVDINDQAFYCPSLDVIAWDRVGLVPRLVTQFGPTAVMVALAHEMGHAVQNRLGIDATAQLEQKARYPTILLEGMADCYSGSATQAAVAGRIPGVHLARTDLDRAMRALLSFSDPISSIGTVPIAAHGNAFDRASAFIDGYSSGPVACAAMTVANQVFTQRSYTSISDELAGGNMALSDIDRLLAADAGDWLGHQVTARGGRWRAPAQVAGPVAGCAAPGSAGQGPVTFCPAHNVITLSTAALGAVHDQLGDYAGGTLLVSRYALAALGALGRPVLGPDAARSAVCLAGAYTRAVFDRRGGFELSPGDIDEAVNVLIDHDFAARDAAGAAGSGQLGFDRVTWFRDGVLGGPGRCGI